MPEVAGALRRRFTLEAPTETVTSGDPSIPWPPQATVWGDLDGLTGLNRGGLTAEAEYRITIRYRSDVTPRWRLGLSGTTRKLGILSVVDPDGTKTRLVILARELLA